MGQKVHPYGFRLGYNKDWHSHWYAKKQFGEFLLEDLKLKKDLKGRFAGAGVSHVDNLSLYGGFRWDHDSVPDPNGGGQACAKGISSLVKIRIH